MGNKGHTLSLSSPGMSEIRMSILLETDVVSQNVQLSTIEPTQKVITINQQLSQRSTQGKELRIGSSRGLKLNQSLVHQSSLSVLRLS
jgi:hypothetical protein